jgi:hypothetical protein
MKTLYANLSAALAHEIQQTGNDHKIFDHNGPIPIINPFLHPIVQWSLRKT